jgi:hypothetical protein
MTTPNGDQSITLYFREEKKWPAGEEGGGGTFFGETASREQCRVAIQQLPNLNTLPTGLSASGENLPVGQ